MQRPHLLREPRRASGLDQAIDNALEWLEDHQEPEGFWVGMLESNSCMEAEWLLGMHVLGVPAHPVRAGALRAILREQRSDGSWEVYHDAPTGDINATVECYAALRASGLEKEAAPLRRAREWILAHGGLGEIRVFTRYWLALIGEWPWEHTPNVPPETIFLPRWFPFNIYHFASWARATLVPMSILSARRRVRPLSAECRLDELFPDGRENFDYSLPRASDWLSWKQLFRVADRALHLYQRLGLTPLRETAIRLATDWIVRHQDADGAWGGIQPPWIYSLMALNGEDFPLDHPVIARGLGALNEHWSYERDGAVYIQASESPVWDTMLALLAMHDCDLTPAQGKAMKRGLDWLLEKQIDAPGDWQVKAPRAPSGGWAFERANTWYPDIDDTGVALMVLARVREEYPDQARMERAIERAVEWTLALQSRNGGWAAFDRDNDLALLTLIPFCDFGEALDPPSADVTAHVLEGFGLLGMRDDHPAVARALKFLRREQEHDGSWFGRWGVNHIYGTAAVLPALALFATKEDRAAMRRAADWVAARQNEDGGWGESCGSYMDPALRGVGESTASQTGWALMAIMATGSARYRRAIERGVSYLVTTQRDGSWDEPQYTGTGFPGYGVGARTELAQPGLGEKLHQGPELARGFMINYNMYRHYFPLMALGRARRYLRAN